MISCRRGIWPSLVGIRKVFVRKGQRLDRFLRREQKWSGGKWQGQGRESSKDLWWEGTAQIWDFERWPEPLRQTARANRGQMRRAEDHFESPGFFFFLSFFSGESSHCYSHTPRSCPTPLHNQIPVFFRAQLEPELSRVNHTNLPHWLPLKHNFLIVLWILNSSETEREQTHNCRKCCQRNSIQAIILKRV